MKLFSIFTATLYLLFVSSTPAFAIERGGDKISLCTINSHAIKYIGHKVRVTVKYESDFLHYSYIEDTHCEKNNVIEMGYLSSMKSPSVTEFLRRGREICAELNAMPCPLSAKIDADIVILRDSEGLSVNLEKIWSYEYCKMP